MAIEVESKDGGETFTIELGRAEMLILVQSLDRACENLPWGDHRQQVAKLRDLCEETL